MRTSARGIDFLISYENPDGPFLTATDVEGNGLYTIGYGHFDDPAYGPGSTITQAEAYELLRGDLNRFEQQVEGAFLRAIPLSQNQFDAMVIWSYNTGAGSGDSTWRELNAGRTIEALIELAGYRSASINGERQILGGLLDRRLDEIELFVGGNYSRDDRDFDGYEDQDRLDDLILDAFRSGLESGAIDPTDAFHFAFNFSGYREIRYRLRQEYVSWNFREASCFPLDTKITIQDSGGHSAITSIAAISANDLILAFDPTADQGRGALVPRKVTRLYRNTTTEWLRLTWEEDGEQKELVTTPGHHFLDRHGRFTRIDRMLEDNRATIVLANGTLAEVRAERILYSAETAHQFERAVAFIDTGDGTAAKPVELDCWQTYNIEVEDLHTYVAGGVRVHNDSGPLGALANDIDAQAFDALGGLIGGPIGGLIDAFGNILTAPLHLAGEILDLLIPGYGDGGRSMTSSAAKVGLDQTAAFVKPLLTVDKNGNPSGQPLSREPNPDNPLGRSDEEQQRAEANLKNWQRVFRNLTDNDRDNGSSSNSNSRQSDKDNVPAPSNLKKPILLDLDGDGIEITELDRSTTFMDASGSGLKHRTAWAGKGDGVLFWDGNSDGEISDDREYIFTEWDPTAGIISLQCAAKVSRNYRT